MASSLGRGVARLDDGREVAGRVAHHAAVLRGIGQHDGRNGGSRRALDMVAAQAREQLGAGQRRVADEHHDVAFEIGQARHAGPQGVARAEALGLHGALHADGSAAATGSSSPAPVTTITRAGVEGGGGVEHVGQQRPSADGVHDLGNLGLHARAQAGGHDDHGQRPARARRSYRLFGRHGIRSHRGGVDVDARLAAAVWLGREDSNLRSRDQNPLPCHLATPQRRKHQRLLPPGSLSLGRRWLRPVWPGASWSPGCRSARSPGCRSVT